MSNDIYGSSSRIMNDYESGNFLYYYLVPSLIFLFSLNFINAFFYIVLGLFAVIIFFGSHKKFAVDLNFAFLLLFCITYVIFTFNDFYRLYGINAILKNFAYIIGYSIGLLLINQYNAKQKNIVRYIMIMVVGTSLHGIMNFAMNLSKYGFNPDNRNLPDIWVGKIVSATGQNLVFALFIGALYYLLFIQKSYKAKILSFIGFVCMILYNFMTASRTVFVLIAVVFIVLFLFLLLMQKKAQLKIIIYIAVFAVILYILYLFNAFGLKSLIDNSPLFFRLESTEKIAIETTRNYKQTFYLTHLFDYPFGGNNMRSQVSYAHNMWLDTYDTVGFLPIIFLLAFTIGVIRNIFKLVKHKNISVEFKTLILGIYLALFLQFSVEPLLEAAPWLFVVFCIISGMVSNFIKFAKNEKESVDYENFVASKYFVTKNRKRDIR